MMKVGHPKGRLMQQFVTVLGPYLSESFCKHNLFFFDCLVVCINPNITPSQRQFWGWWLELRLEEDGLTGYWEFGRCKKLKWYPEEIKDEQAYAKVKENWDKFHPRLQKTLSDCNLQLQSLNCISSTRKHC